MIWSLILSSSITSDNATMCFNLANELKKQKHEVRILLVDHALDILDPKYKDDIVKSIHNLEVSICSRAFEDQSHLIFSKSINVGSLSEFLEQPSDHWYSF